MYASRALPVPLAPFADESLEGFVVRGCYVNGFDKPNQLFKILGYGLAERHWHTSLREEHAPSLGKHFGCAADQLTARFHVATAVPETTVVFEDFFGIPIRAFLRESTIRRFSPAAVKARDYHRAIWLLRPFRYCPETGEKLLGACPECDRNLGWKKVYGIGFCEHCVEDGYSLVDLRRVERPRLSDKELVPYRATVDLILKPMERSPIFPSYFDNWPAWELFDLILTLAAMLLRSHDLDKSMKRGQIYSSLGWHSNFLSAIEILCNWPESAACVIDEALRVCVPQGHGSYGRRAILGPFANPEFHAGSPRVAFEIKTAVERTLPLTEEERLMRGRRGGPRSFRSKL
jgi:hypothetical protein